MCLMFFELPGGDPLDLNFGSSLGRIFDVCRPTSISGVSGFDFGLILCRCLIICRIDFELCLR